VRAELLNMQTVTWRNTGATITGVVAGVDADWLYFVPVPCLDTQAEEQDGCLTFRRDAIQLVGPGRWVTGHGRVVRGAPQAWFRRVCN
jgi:hypothetical protein